MISLSNAFPANDKEVVSTAMSSYTFGVLDQNTQFCYCNSFCQFLGRPRLTPKRPKTSHTETLKRNFCVKCVAYSNLFKCFICHLPIFRSALQHSNISSPILMHPGDKDCSLVRQGRHILPESLEESQRRATQGVTVQWTDPRFQHLCSWDTESADAL
jgi:hypothetical protein